jgi:hypothetical protein
MQRGRQLASARPGNSFRLCVVGCGGAGRPGRRDWGMGKGVRALPTPHQLHTACAPYSAPASQHGHETKHESRSGIEILESDEEEGTELGE